MLNFRYFFYPYVIILKYFYNILMVQFLNKYYIYIYICIYCIGFICGNVDWGILKIAYIYVLNWAYFCIGCNYIDSNWFRLETAKIFYVFNAYWYFPAILTNITNMAYFE